MLFFFLEKRNGRKKIHLKIQYRETRRWLRHYSKTGCRPHNAAPRERFYTASAYRLLHWLHTTAPAPRLHQRCNTWRSATREKAERKEWTDGGKKIANWLHGTARTRRRILDGGKRPDNAGKNSRMEEPDRLFAIATFCFDFLFEREGEGIGVDPHPCNADRLATRRVTHAHGYINSWESV